MVGTRMMPTDSGGSGSGSWKKLLNLSPGEGSIGDGANLPTDESVRVSAGEAGPSHPAHEEAPTFSRNMSFETSLRGRIEALEGANSPFLPQEERGEYWREVKRQLHGAADQKEYNQRLDFENRDLQVREEKEVTLHLLKELIDNNYPDVNPGEAMKDYFNQWEQNLAAQAGQGILDSLPTSGQELDFVREVTQDLQAHGQQSFYFHKILGSE